MSFNVVRIKNSQSENLLGITVDLDLKFEDQKITNAEKLVPKLVLCEQ